MKHFSILLALITSLSFSQDLQLAPKVENIAWIAGNWYGEALGGHAEEHWSEPSAKSMMGSFKFVANDRVSFYEIMIIREINSSLLLQLKHFRSDLKGWEHKDDTVDFNLLELTKNKAVFDGITFERVTDHEMNVYLDLEENRKSETVKFNYKKELQAHKTLKQLIKVKKANTTPTIDGIADESIWKTTEWHQLDQLWLGNAYSPDDFQGQYKLTWTDDALYLLAEIKDDTLMDKTEDPLVAWWDDDCLEIFIDEDNSGGEHQFNHNAFAYHIALDGNVVDMSPEKNGKLYNSHIESKRITTGNTSIWEVKISLYKDTYKDDSKNTPATLKANKNIGFALAYCDNDTSDIRENFIGSIYVEGDDKNRGYIDASIFGTLLLHD
jgi:hypothetical protein